MNHVHDLGSIEDDISVCLDALVKLVGKVKVLNIDGLPTQDDSTKILKLSSRLSRLNNTRLAEVRRIRRCRIDKIGLFVIGQN